MALAKIVSIDEEFEKSRTKGAKDIKKRKSKELRQLYQDLKLWHRKKVKGNVHVRRKAGEALENIHDEIEKLEGKMKR
jgi:hypothetical protein